MVRTITRQQYEADAASLLETVSATHEPVIIESDGLALAVLISAEEYERWVEDRSQHAWEVVDRIRELNADDRDEG